MKPNLTSAVVNPQCNQGGTQDVVNATFEIYSAPATPKAPLFLSTKSGCWDEQLRESKVHFIRLRYPLPRGRHLWAAQRFSRKYDSFFLSQVACALRHFAPLPVLCATCASRRRPPPSPDAFATSGPRIEKLVSHNYRDDFSQSDPCLSWKRRGNPLKVAMVDATCDVKWNFWMRWCVRVNIKAYSSASDTSSLSKNSKRALKFWKLRKLSLLTSIYASCSSHFILTSVKIYFLR